IAVNPSLRGSHVEFGMASDGRTDTQIIGFDYEALHLRPLSPVHAKTKRVGDDVHISWIRRTRIGGDDWASLDVPLGEESEAYEVDFLDNGTVLLTKQVNISELFITVPELENLYGAPLTDINISIFQISQSFGRGAARETTFTL
ncbi:MAG: hypothetical protein JKX72_08995, partial [Robiginitomaculum sp.]|nr:hypothetical protein [Robiginitomaculum sp.]